jgi:hypothetical protein
VERRLAKNVVEGYMEKVLMRLSQLQTCNTILGTRKSSSCAWLAVCRRRPLFFL